jgi:Nif-specific regulatory protein
VLSTIDARKFNTLIEINTLINSNYTDVHGLLTRIIDSATKLCDGEASSLLLVDWEHQELYFEASVGETGSDVKQYTVKLGEGIAGWVATHNKSLIVNDVENDKRHSRTIARNTGYESKTMLAVPMRIKDRCIGVIELLNKKNGKYFSQEDLEWLEIFANQAAITIQNAQSFVRVLDHAANLEEQLTAGSGYHTLIAKSPLIFERIEMADRYAKTDASVLIQGESGVGKELFAEQIHLRSTRKDQPFIRVNCAAIPEGLLESELFGHVKGAFTNAIQTRRGRFEMADRGTIFLDEIGDMPPALQAKLLRVLQQKTFEKVGSDVTVSVDVRIIAATNRDIERLVEQGAFRNDLYYRLNVLPLYIPPLRQRPEDIPELASFFLKNMIKKTRKEIEGFTDEAVEAMISYSWPGNIRELQNSVERASVIGGGKWLAAADLFPDLAGEGGSGGPAASVSAEDGRANLKNALNAFKTHYIQKVLEENHWNQTEAAGVLDIQRTYLSRLIKELGIVSPRERTTGTV